jgi:RNA polymerase sigma factor (TIGR02999 family)
VVETGDVTQLLLAYRDGDSDALDRLVPLVYDDLRRIAHVHARRDRVGQTLNTTALVHEVYLRLVDQTQVKWEDSQHFLSVCARAMRQIVVSNARRRAARKRGGDRLPVTLDEEHAPDAGKEEWFLALDQALDRLAGRNPRLARVVECRYFAGLSEQETADGLGASLRTVQRDWARAKAWLREDLGTGLDGKDTGP